MNQTSKLTIPGLAIAFCAIVIQTAQAGAISLSEIATPDLGLASVGYAARAGDVFMVFKNPAGMSQLPGAPFQGGLQALYGSVNSTTDGNTSRPLGTDGGENALGWLPTGSLFVTLPLSENVAVRLGGLSYCGLAEEYGDDWVGREYVQRSTLLGMGLTPSVRASRSTWAQPAPTAGGDMSVDQGSEASLCGRASGHYKNCWSTFAHLNLTWKRSQTSPSNGVGQ